MLIFIYFYFASALSALHLYNEPKFMVIGNPVILEQSHAHNAPDLWDRGSIPFCSALCPSGSTVIRVSPPKTVAILFQRIAVFGVCDT